MNSNIDGRILATFFVAVAALAAAAATPAGGISMITPTFAQSENMTEGGNAPEGNMPPPPPDTSGGMASPPPSAMRP